MQITLNNVKIKLHRLEEGKPSTVPRGWVKVYEALNEGDVVYGTGPTGVVTVVKFEPGEWAETGYLSDGDLWTYSHDLHEALSQGSLVNTI